MMAKNYSRVLLVTANVGSIFEEPEKMIPIWMQEFIAIVTKLEPEFLAIHCQEVGGKNYEETMQHVNKFIKMLLSLEEMQQFNRARVFLDEDFTAVEKFTALGSLYFIHSSISSVEIFDFQDAKFVPVEGKEVLSGNIEHVRIKEKAKFAQEFFPDFVWSRKGFIRTRWNLYGTMFDLVNIHLIHDVNNIAAMETSPSTYSGFRVRALLHTIERFETDQYEKVPFFMFGDYNFRLDTHHLVKKLTESAVEQRVAGKKNDISKVIFKTPDSDKVILTVGKKDFHHHEHNQLFSRQHAMTLREYDTEPEVCRSKLFEYQVTFPPSYPFSEDADDGTSYMPTRCPGWCDRIMMSHDASSLFHVDNGFTSEYKMIGMHICMGDHKPIYLNLQLRHKASAASGNNDGRQDSTSDPTIDDSPTRRHAPIRKVISINGEEVDAESANIHDFTTFEKEDLLGSAFMDGIKRKSTGSGGGGEGGPPPRRLVSFRNTVKSIIHSEAVMRALKHYSHRSDSEQSEDDELEIITHVEQVIDSREAETEPVVEQVTEQQEAETVAHVEQVIDGQDIEPKALVEQITEGQEAENKALVEQVTDGQDVEIEALVEQQTNGQEAKTEALVEQVTEGQEAETEALVEQQTNGQEAETEPVVEQLTDGQEAETVPRVEQVTDGQDGETEALVEQVTNGQEAETKALVEQLTDGQETVIVSNNDSAFSSTLVSPSSDSGTTDTISIGEVINPIAVSATNEACVSDEIVEHLLSAHPDDDIAVNNAQLCHSFLGQESTSNEQFFSESPLLKTTSNCEGLLINSKSRSETTLSVEIPSVELDKSCSETPDLIGSSCVDHTKPQSVSTEDFSKPSFASVGSNESPSANRNNCPSNISDAVEPFSLEQNKFQCENEKLQPTKPETEMESKNYEVPAIADYRPLSQESAKCETPKDKRAESFTVTPETPKDTALVCLSASVPHTSDVEQLGVDVESREVVEKKHSLHSASSLPVTSLQPVDNTFDSTLVTTESSIDTTNEHESQDMPPCKVVSPSQGFVNGSVGKLDGASNRPDAEGDNSSTIERDCGRLLVSKSPNDSAIPVIDGELDRMSTDDDDNKTDRPTDSLLPNAAGNESPKNHRVTSDDADCKCCCIQ